MSDDGALLEHSAAAASDHRRLAGDAAAPALAPAVGRGAARVKVFASDSHHLRSARSETMHCVHSS